MARVSDEELLQLAHILGQKLHEKGWMLACAESCTGGWLSQLVTAIPGSSAWFDRGFVTYSNQAKQDMLGVSTATLETHGAVSEETVREMATGTLKHSHAQISASILRMQPSKRSGSSRAMCMQSLMYVLLFSFRSPAQYSRKLL